MQVLARWKDVCPHESEPPDPDCAPRPLADVEVVVRSGEREVARGTTADDGTVTFHLAPGTYVVEGEPRDGFRITPQPVEVVVVDGGSAAVVLDYETGRQ